MSRRPLKYVLRVIALVVMVVNFSGVGRWLPDGGEDVRGLASREVAELMDRLGALPAAASFRLLVAIRNRIAHSYPDDPERQAGNLNAAYEAVPDLLAAHEGVRRYLERRLPGG